MRVITERHQLVGLKNTFEGFLPLLSAPPAELSGVGSMSSKPQDTLCFPPKRQDGEPGPPSKSKSLKQEMQGGYTSKESLIITCHENQSRALTCTGHLTQGVGPDQFVSAGGELCG